MIGFKLTLAFIFVVFGQDTYYVSVTGTDSGSCGNVTIPCASIDQIMTNFPGASFTLSITSGNYNTDQIEFQRSAFVIFQGVGFATITTNYWTQDSFITNTDSSGFEFHDLSLNVGDGRYDFSTLNTVKNSAGFYNVVLNHSSNRDFLVVIAGTLVVNNVTLSAATFYSHLFIDFGEGDSASITITGSNFSNMVITNSGGDFLLVDAEYGPANIVINDTIFNNISANDGFIQFGAYDKNQNIAITNTIFNNTNSYLPMVYLENDVDCTIVVQNTTWINTTAAFVCGALEIVDASALNQYIPKISNITLDYLIFISCTGPYTGGLAVVYNSLALSNSNFSHNSGGHCNDVIQVVLSGGQYDYTITNSYSSSGLPKAMVLNANTSAETDISEQLPSPPGDEDSSHLTPADVFVSLEFRRKISKKKN